MRDRPLLRRLVALAMLLLAAVAAGASGGTVAAHAELVDTTPAPGEQLDVSPPVIELRFTEDVQLVADAVTLLTETGDVVPLPEATVAGAVVTVTVPALDDGGYVVDWQVVSADGHPITGAFPFAVGEAAPPDVASAGTRSDRTDVLWLWRALTYTGFAVVLGVWAFVLTCWWAGRSDRVLGDVLTAGALVALVGAVGRILAEASVLGVDVGDTFDLRSGRAWWLLVALAALMLAARPLLRASSTTAPAAAAWVVAAAVTGLAIAYAGHGASGRMTTAGTLLTVVHVAAASVWVGGLLGLLRVLRVTTAAQPVGAAVDQRAVAARGVDVAPVDAAAVVRRFSGIALVIVAVLGATGTLQAIRQLRDWDALTDSDYGRALLIKLAVVAVLVAVATISRTRARYVSTGRARPASLRNVVAVEIGLAAAAMLATGWLAGESPVVEVAASAGPVTVSAVDPATGATATVEVDPASAGPNQVAVRVARPGTPVQEIIVDVAPLDESLPAVRLDVLEVGAGYVVADDVAMAVPGTWIVTVEARLGEFDLVRIPVEVTIAGS